MKLVCKIACLALLMNTLPGIGQERVFYETVQVNGLNIFYREAGPANARSFFCFTAFQRRLECISRC